MPEEIITKKTRWECQYCGNCCIGIIPSKNKSLSVIEDNKLVCKFFDKATKKCKDYENRAFICRIYPFVINLDVIVGKDNVARPQNAFLLENLKIHTECSGYGKGKRIYANKNLIRKLEKLGYKFALDFKKAFKKEIDVSEMI